MAQRARGEWLTDGIEVSVTIVLFALVYVAVAIGGLYTLARSSGRRLRRSPK